MFDESFGNSATFKGRSVKSDFGDATMNSVLVS